jgi:hypothetical protein
LSILSDSYIIATPSVVTNKHKNEFKIEMM